MEVYKMLTECKHNENDNKSKSKFYEYVKKFWPMYAISAVVPVAILSSLYIKYLKNKNVEDKKLKNKALLKSLNLKVEEFFKKSGYKFYHQRKIESLDEYINGEIISENILKLNNLLKTIKLNPEIKKYFNNFSHVSYCPIVSSDRGSMNNKPTEFEKKLDEAVDNGDLPIKQFTLSQIDDLYNEKIKNYNSSSKATFFKMPNIDALDLYQHANDGAVVQVASQFNALESTSNRFSPVKNWFDDHTQGPRCSLQDVISTKHREAAYLKGKLPDAIKGILDKCHINGNIYNNGYLELYNIGSTGGLQKLKNHITDNIMNLGLNSQWVVCENGHKQFQLFLAAPSFQGHSIDWEQKDERTKNFKEICKVLVVAQYKASAQIAVIKSIKQNKQIELHVTRIGQQSFGNPKEIMVECLNVIHDIVKNYNVKVILHDYLGNSWDEDMKKINFSITEIQKK